MNNVTAKRYTVLALDELSFYVLDEFIIVLTKLYPADDWGTIWGATRVIVDMELK